MLILALIYALLLIWSLTVYVKTAQVCPLIKVTCWEECCGFTLERPLAAEWNRLQILAGRHLPS